MWGLPGPWADPGSPSHAGEMMKAVTYRSQVAPPGPSAAHPEPPPGPGTAGVPLVPASAEKGSRGS